MLQASILTLELIHLFLGPLEGIIGKLKRRHRYVPPLSYPDGNYILSSPIRGLPASLVSPPLQLLDLLQI